MAKSRCALCERSPGVLWVPGLDLAFCDSCTRRVGEYVLSGDRSSLAPIWIVLPQSKRPTIDRADADTHADLAKAYLEMGLLTDAMAEAAGVLCAGDIASPAAVALQILFNKKLARRHAIRQLRRLLQTN